VYVSSAALYNDGSPAPQVTLAPFDGVLLQRQTPLAPPASRVNFIVNAASYQPAIASGELIDSPPGGSAPLRPQTPRNHRSPCSVLARRH